MIHSTPSLPAGSPGVFPARSFARSIPPFVARRSRFAWCARRIRLLAEGAAVSLGRRAERPALVRSASERSRWSFASLTLGALLALSVGAQAEPLDEWTKVTVAAGVLTSPNDLIFANGKYTAVGSEGKAQQSADGKSWTVVQTGATSQLISVAYGNGRYVAVGMALTIVSSADGQSWAKHQEFPENGFKRYNQVLFANGKFIAVGSNGDVRLSTNGTDWTAASMGQADFNPRGVAWANGQYVVVGSGNLHHCVMTSPDGVTWTKRNVSFTTDLNSIAFANSIFVAAGVSQIATSPDGVTWTKQAPSYQYSNSRTTVRFMNGRFVAYGQHGVLKSSADRVQWTNHVSGTTTDIAAIAYNGDRALLFRYSIVSSGSGPSESAHWPAVGVPSDPPVPNDPPSPNPGSSNARLVNMSTRAFVGTGPNVLVSGFFISGAAPKKVLIRGVGPTLTQFGISGVLADPQVRIFNAAGQEIGMSDNWSTQSGATEIAQAAAANGAFALPNGSADAALIATLAPGAYSAVVAGANATSGIAIVEVYDLQPGGVSRLSNLSSRTYVGTGEQVSIAGFVVTGSQPKSYLVRGIGPALGPFGVTGVLPNPALKVMASGGAVVASNDDWSAYSDQVKLASASAAAGAFALSNASLDAALVVTLNPGSYSVLVNDAGGASGVSLIEVYELP